MAGEHSAPETPSVLERLLGNTEPVRRALYPVIVTAVALLVFYGRLSAESVPLWLALAVAVLGIGGTEAARATVWSPRSVDRYGAVWREYAEDEFARGVAVTSERTPDRVAAETTAMHEQQLDDGGGEHATGRCREVENGRRCAMQRGHAGPHKMT